MASGLYARVSARGFPSSVAAGYTGEGALDSQGGPTDPAHGQAANATSVSTIPGYDAPTDAPPVGVDLIEGTWGLSGSPDTDATPRSHAAPVPGWAGSYDDPELLTVHENSAVIHAQDFGGLAKRTQVPLSIVEPDYDVWSSNEPGEVALDKVSGQLRAMGGRDDVQGYGLRNRYGFDAGHRTRIVDQGSGGQPMAYLDPAERIFVVPQASGSFTPTDEIQGPGAWSSYLDAGNVNPTDPSPYEPAPEAATLATPQAGGAASAGWWS